MTATYRYDGLGRRIEKNVNGVIKRYIYDGENILLEYDGSNLLTSRYTNGLRIDEPLIIESAGQSFFYHIDGLRSITEITDSTGIIATSYVYNSFGQVITQNGSVTNTYTYTGQEFDSETGLYYYRARYYDSNSGRFLQEDPFPGVIGKPQSLNYYPYVLNNPINFIDPLGLAGIGPNCRENAKKALYFCLGFFFIAAEAPTAVIAGGCFLAGGVAGLAACSPALLVLEEPVIVGSVGCFLDYWDRLKDCDENKCSDSGGPPPCRESCCGCGASGGGGDSFSDR